MKRKRKLSIWEAFLALFIDTFFRPKQRNGNNEMSTKATIAHMSGAWHLYEEMNQEEVYIDIHMDHADFIVCKYDIRLRLPEGVIDAIRAAKPACIPHLRKKATP